MSVDSLVRYYYLSLGMQWTKISSRLCRPGGTYSNLVQAQTACLQLGSSCHGVYDEHCDGRKLYLCKASPFSTSHGAGCLYKPTSAISTASFTATTGVALRNAVQNCLANSPKNGNCVNIPRCISTETIDYSPGQVHDVRSEEDLKKLQSTGQLVVTDWYAQWCGPCTNFKPTFQKMAEEQTDILFCKIEKKSSVTTKNNNANIFVSSAEIQK